MNIAVVGGGYIIPEFLRAAQATAGLTVRGIWARRAEVCAQLAAEYHLAQAYDSYEALLADPEVHAVYIALPNYLHFPFALQALDAGKDVLLEKPLTLTLDGAQELFARARQTGHYVFETITNRYCPNFAAIRSLLPQLGTLRMAVLNYSQYSSRYARFCAGILTPVFDPAQGGGALMDLNIYNLHLAVGWFGSPLRVHYAPNAVRGIDTSGVLLMEYDGFSCICIGAKDCSAPSGLTLQGDCGYITSDTPPNRLSAYTLQLNDQPPRQAVLPPRASRMCDELDAWRDHLAVRDDAWFDEQAAHSLRVMSVVESAWRGCGLQLNGR